MPDRHVLIKGGYLATVDPDLGDVPNADILVREVSLARVMGPPDCQGDGTTVARY